MKKISLPTYIDLAIVGAGPQALTLVTHLLQKRAKFRNRFLVFDPSGTWLSRWRHQFAAQKIPHLRSPAVHHPDPNPYALRAFAENRPHELFPPYDLPGTQLFEDFCGEVIRRWQLENCIYPEKVVEILPHKHRFQLILAAGESIIARRVILATGKGIPQFPEWVNRIPSPYPSERLCHSSQIDLRSLHLAGEKILIIGGGLTSGHLAMGAIAQNANVFLMARRTWQEKLFDADPGWLGPKYLKGFAAESNWYRRWELIQQARNGGSMTPAMMLQLRRLSREGKITLKERCEIVGAIWQDSHWLVKCANGDVYECDRIWLATGTKFDCQQNPLLEDMLAAYPTEIVNGLPVLDEYLRLPGSEFFLMGALAALQVGPVARNLSGGRMASDRIVRTLTKASIALSS
ncbi:FAD/NAD(P)-binding protein [Hydrococcus rivularis]|uniref:FAD/NAD(P)-binding protein n=1 Tax=Hydrococcus rivularis TaxID=1616834 RepID=UPI000AB6C8FB|nr:FAD/NAD(P)-binding protein [Hydrococcus rivularis]